MARNVYGLDLGTYDIKIFDKKKDRIWHAKNVICLLYTSDAADE